MIDDAPRRLFIAAWPPPELAKRLTALTNRHRHPDLRPVPIENLHVTLRFLGMSPVAPVVEALNKLAFQPAAAAIESAPVWLDHRQLVVAVTGVDELADVARTATAHIGEQPKHEFFGHLTLARSKDEVETPLTERTIAERFAVDDIRLVASETLPAGAEYTVIETFPIV